MSLAFAHCSPLAYNICLLSPFTAYLTIGGVTGPDSPQINRTHAILIDSNATEPGLDCEGDVVVAANPDFPDRDVVLGFGANDILIRHRTFMGGPNAGQFGVVAEGSRSYVD